MRGGLGFCEGMGISERAFMQRLLSMESYFAAKEITEMKVCKR
jgi:hypothetical protein